MDNKTSEVSVAIYVRVANINFKTYDAASFQLSRLVDYAKDILHTDKIEIYQDLGYTGGSLERPSFQKMMDDITSGNYTHLLVISPDRIARNVADFFEVLKILKIHNIELISIKD